MRLVCITFCFITFFICSCVQQPVQQEPVPTDPLEAVLYYEKLLQKAKDAGSPELKIQELQLQLDTAQQQMIVSYLTQGRLLAEDDRKNLVKAHTDAITLLNNITKWDIDHQVVDEISILTGKRDKYRERLIEIDNRHNAFQFDTALNDVEELLVLRPANRDLLARKQDIEHHKNQFINIEHQVRAGNLKEAHKNLKAAMAGFTEATIEVWSFYKTFIEKIVSEGDKLIEQEKYIGAVDLLESFELADLKSEIRRMKFIAVHSFQQRAAQAFSQGNIFLSYLLVQKADSFSSILNPNNTFYVKDEIFELRKTTSDFVDRSIQEYIAIASFDSPQHAPDAGAQFSDSLASYMYNNLPYGINILERDKIDAILEEHKNSEQNAGEILGANLIVTGRVSLFKTETSEDIRNASVKVLIDEQLVENPEYTQMLRLYGVNENTWPSLPPKLIPKNMYQILQYKKGTARLKGFAKVSVRIFDTEKANITFVKDYPASIEDVSEFQDEVDLANIPYIPRKLISTIEAKDAMRNEIITAIGQVVQSSFDSRERRFLNQAKYYLERRESYKAIDPLAKGYHYCMRDNIAADNPYFVELQQLVDSIID